ncbi:MAG: zinc ribbon domain-containing protein [Ilumatobacteraceae bacterium]
MVALQFLLELQKIDTALSQLVHRQANLDERKVLAAAKAALIACQGENAKTNNELVSAKTEITNLETANKKCEAQIVKYSQQLKTVIAPREAEALQHEIETVRAERSANDDKELLLLETSERLEQHLQQLAQKIIAQSLAVATATEALNEALKICDSEKKSLDEKRLAVAGAIDSKLIKLYDVKRTKRTTPAVADLHGSKCQSCHLDLSVVELSALKKLGADELAECPNCDCYLVL